MAPLYATTPLTYVWEIEGQTPVTHTGGLSDTLTMSWEMAGSYELLVTAVNASGIPVTETHTVLVGLDEPKIYLPSTFRND